MPKEQEVAGGRELIETVLKVYRSAAVVKGGRRFSFEALVVVGDGQGQVGIGYGRANEVPSAVDKAIASARANMRRVMLAGGTIPHAVLRSFGSSKVLLRPAAPGTGIIAGAGVRAVVEAAGVKDVLSKVFGSRNLKNVTKATMNALLALRTRAEVERLRGVKLE